MLGWKRSESAQLREASEHLQAQVQSLRGWQPFSAQWSYQLEAWNNDDDECPHCIRHCFTVVYMNTELLSQWWLALKTHLPDT